MVENIKNENILENSEKILDNFFYLTWLISSLNFKFSASKNDVLNVTWLSRFRRDSRDRFAAKLFFAR